MLQSTGCRRILFNGPTAKLSAQVDAHMLSNGVKIRLENIDIFHDIFSDLLSGRLTSNNTALYPAPPIDTDMNIPMTYLHSSGSTGLPKSIPIARKLLIQHLRLSESHVDLLYTTNCLFS